MSMLTSALGVDPLIAAARKKDAVGLKSALKALYRRYVKADAIAFEAWLDSIIKG